MPHQELFAGGVLLNTSPHLYKIKKECPSSYKHTLDEPFEPLKNYLVATILYLKCRIG